MTYRLILSGEIYRKEVKEIGQRTPHTVDRIVMPFGGRDFGAAFCSLAEASQEQEEKQEKAIISQLKTLSTALDRVFW